MFINDMPSTDREMETKLIMFLNDKTSIDSDVDKMNKIHKW